MLGADIIIGGKGWKPCCVYSLLDKIIEGREYPEGRCMFCRVCNLKFRLVGGKFVSATGLVRTRGLV